MNKLVDYKLLIDELIEEYNNISNSKIFTGNQNQYNYFVSDFMEFKIKPNKHNPQKLYSIKWTLAFRNKNNDVGTIIMQKRNELPYKYIKELKNSKNLFYRQCYAELIRYSLFAIPTEKDKPFQGIHGPFHTYTIQQIINGETNR